MQHGNTKMMGTARTWTGAAGRVLAAGALALSLCGTASLSNAPAARADDTPGNVTINVTAGASTNGRTRDANDPDDVRYSAYRVFAGDVGLDTSKGDSRQVTENEITDVSWASDPMREAVTKAIKAWDTNYVDPKDESESALKAAEFIANHIGPGGSPSAGNPSQDQALQLESSQFGSLLMKEIRDYPEVGVTEARTSSKEGASLSELEPGVTYSFDDGWYLFVTSKPSLNLKRPSQAGTSPIYAVVGGKDVTITEKDSVPTLAKRVRDDSAVGEGESGWGLAADANAGQDVEYRLVGTVADNIQSFDSYYYRFDDVLDEGLVFNAQSGTGAENGDARVFLHKAHDRNAKSASEGDKSCEVTSNFEFKVTSKGRKMSIEAQDLRNLIMPDDGSTYRMVAGDYLTVEYTAKIDPGSGTAAQGGTGNANTATVVYANNPKTDSRGTSISQETRLYTYSLRVHKQDKQNAARALPGAKFTLRVCAGDEEGSKCKYVQADGSLGDEPHEFETDGNGDILVKNLDAGTYQLEETAAPDAKLASGNEADVYEPLDPAQVVIGSNVHSATDAQGKSYASGNLRDTEPALQKLEMSSSATAESGFGHGSLIVAADSVDSSGNASGDGLHASPGSGGTVNAVVREAKETQMPLTGGAGIAFFGVFGGLAVASGASMLARRRSGGSGRDEC